LIILIDFDIIFIQEFKRIVKPSLTFNDAQPFHLWSQIK